MRTVRLGEDEIAEFLTNLPDWTRAEQAISRTYSFESFAAAMEFVNQVAEEAERRDHHPDMDIRYDKVTVALATHYLKGLTAKDMTLAGVCDQFADEAKL
jgi:4a-hydroxytetrahydrobiopterin dehydratase